MRRCGLPEGIIGNFRIAPYRGPIPDTWSGRGRWKSGPLHTFVDDYRQEFFWRRPQEGLIVAMTAGIVTAPDFTVFPGEPLEYARWQAWRSCAIAATWQSQGVNVLPVVSRGANDPLPL